MVEVLYGNHSRSVDYLCGTKYFRASNSAALSRMASKKDDYYGVPMQDDGHELDDLNAEHRPGSPFSPSLLARPRQESVSVSAHAHAHQIQPARPLSSIANNPTASILGYCLASISMTVVNKYVVSGSDWNLMFLYLAIQVRAHCLRVTTHAAEKLTRPTLIQSIVCILAVLVCQQLGFLSLERFNSDNAKQCESRLSRGFET